MTPDHPSIGRSGPYWRLTQLALVTQLADVVLVPYGVYKDPSWHLSKKDRLISVLFTGMFGAVAATRLRNVRRRPELALDPAWRRRGAILSTSLFVAYGASISPGALWSYGYGGGYAFLFQLTETYFMALFGAPIEVSAAIGLTGPVATAICSAVANRDPQPLGPHVVTQSLPSGAVWVFFASLAGTACAGLFEEMNRRTALVLARANVAPSKTLTQDAEAEATTMSQVREVLIRLIHDVRSTEPDETTLAALERALRGVDEYPSHTLGSPTDARPAVSQLDLIDRVKASIGRDHSVPVNLELSGTGEVAAIQADWIEHFVRVLIQNIRAHGSGSRAEVRIKLRPRTLDVEVDEVGAIRSGTATIQQGHGLHAVFSYTQLLGGTSEMVPLSGGTSRTIGSVPRTPVEREQ